ncbi:hypothetical protein GCM10027514_16560 [Azotobacter armeniacus]
MIRAGRLQPLPESAAHVISWHLEADGTLFDLHAAAIELLNVIRPVVAVAVYLTFIVRAIA